MRWFLLLWALLDEDIRVELLVVEVVELHRAALERMSLVVFLLLIRDFRRDEDAFLEEMSRRDNRVRVQLPVVLDLLDSREVFLSVGPGADVGVSRAYLNCVAELLAAIAADLCALHFFNHLVVLVVVIVFLRLVLRVLAAESLLVFFAAAPPDFTAELASMRAATPIEVLLLDVVLAAILAHFLKVIELSTPHFKFLDTIFHLFAVDDEVFLFFLELHFGLEELVRLICLQFHVPFQVHLLLLVEFDCLIVRLLQLELLIDQMLRFFHVEVSLTSRISNVLREHLGLLVLLLHL